MIIVLNGYPGVGKLTIGRELAASMGGRMLDIHSVYNVAIALTEFKSPEFIETVEEIESIAHNLIRKLPAEQPVVLTTVLTESGHGADEWGRQEWRRITELAGQRPPLFVVHVSCDLQENRRRIELEDRVLKRKLTDPEVADRNHVQAMPLLGHDEEHLLTLDTTQLSPEEAARDIRQCAASIDAIAACKGSNYAFGNTAEDVRTFLGFDFNCASVKKLNQGAGWWAPCPLIDR